MMCVRHREVRDMIEEFLLNCHLGREVVFFGLLLFLQFYRFYRANKIVGCLGGLREILERYNPLFAFKFPIGLQF